MSRSAAKATPVAGAHVQVAGLVRGVVGPDRDRAAAGEQAGGLGRAAQNATDPSGPPVAEFVAHDRGVAGAAVDDVEGRGRGPSRRRAEGVSWSRRRCGARRASAARRGSRCRRSRRRGRARAGRTSRGRRRGRRPPAPAPPPTRRAAAPSFSSQHLRSAAYAAKRCRPSSFSAIASVWPAIARSAAGLRTATR